MFDRALVPAGPPTQGRPHLALPLAIATHALACGLVAAASLFTFERANDPLGIDSLPPLIIFHEPALSPAPPRVAPPKAVTPPRTSSGEISHAAASPPPRRPLSFPDLLPPAEASEFAVAEARGSGAAAVAVPGDDVRALFGDGQKCSDCDAGEIYTEGDPSIVAPVLVSSPEPVYPEPARRFHASGTVVLRVVVGADGRVARVDVVRSVPLLDSAAIEAASRRLYRPASLGGRAVAVSITLNVRFQLER